MNHSAANYQRRSPHQLSRRSFLSLAAGSSALGLTGAGSAAAAMRAFHGRGGPSDYKALVCVFLFGGADTFNLLVPTSTAEFDIYAASRGDLAEERASLLPISPLTPDGATYGTHASTPEIQGLFQSGKLAFVPNVGPLVRPVTKAEVLAGSPDTPANLFSHNDQQTQWQSAHADGSRRTGWAGRVLDRMTGASPAPLSPAVSIELTGELLVGAGVQPYVLGLNGTEPLALAENANRRSVIDSIMRSEHALGAEFARIQNESNEINDLIGQELNSAPAFTGLFPASNLGQQLRMVARMISIRAQLGVRRQVFFVGAGGFDTHDDQETLLPLLFRNLSLSMGAFQSAMEQISAAEDVTAFTHTEFGRTLTSNGQGSDHGWGGHAMVMGGAVRGQDIYGAMPSLALGGADDVGQGRMVPKLAVDQFGASLSRWFGLTEPELDLVFPNLSNFASRDLGFL